MKKLVVPLYLALAAVPSAFAQQASWAGPYVGVNLGYGFGNSDTSVSLGGAWAVEGALQDTVRRGLSRELKANGPTFGIQGGYDFQVGGNYVLGVDAGYSALNMDRSKEHTITSGGLAYETRNEVDFKQLFALRAKGGLLVDRTLFYVTAGWAWADVEMGTQLLGNNGYSKAARSSKIVDGYTVGLGAEHRFSGNWSVRLDYAYTDFGKAGYSTHYRPGSTFVSPVYSEHMKQDLEMHQVNFGVNYRF